MRITLTQAAYDLLTPNEDRLYFIIRLTWPSIATVRLISRLAREPGTGGASDGTTLWFVTMTAANVDEADAYVQPLPGRVMQPRILISAREVAGLVGLPTARPLWFVGDDYGDDCEGLCTAATRARDAAKDIALRL